MAGMSPRDGAQDCSKREPEVTAGLDLWRAFDASAAERAAHAATFARLICEHRAGMCQNWVHRR